MHKIYFGFILLATSLVCSCKAGNAVGTSEFDRFIFSVPEELASEEQLEIRDSILSVIWNYVEVRNDRFVFHFDEAILSEHRIPAGYCRWMKKSMKEQSRNFRRIKRSDETLSAVSLQQTFEESRAEYLRTKGKQTYAQPSFSNLFIYGNKVQTCEDNLRNLFRNWSFVRGADIKLISYHYAGSVTGEDNLRALIRQNMKAPAFNCSSSVNEGTPEIKFTPVKQKTAREYRLITDELVSVHIKDGYQIYKIEFTHDRDDFEYYIFINPQTLKPVLKYNLFGVQF